MSGTPVVDQSFIDDLRGIDDGKALRALVELFTSDTPPRVKDLVDGARRGDAVRVRAVSHTVKGSAALLGAAALAELLGAIERDAATGAVPDADELGQLVVAMQEAIDELTRAAS